MYVGRCGVKMRNYKIEFEKRVAYIKSLLVDSRATGIVYGNSGGKDSALVGILCKAACDNTVGIIMPCMSKRNFEEDMKDGKAIAKQFKIETRILDLSDAKKTMMSLLTGVTELSDMALSNIAPRLRMISLYAVAASENRLVAGTGNRSEGHMGYFTKWGDGAHDFNPIADLTVRETYEFLAYLNAPVSIIKKAPSAGLFEGQTDESEMGITYDAIDTFLLEGIVTPENKAIIDRFHNRSEHKRKLPSVYKDEE